LEVFGRGESTTFDDFGSVDDGEPAVEFTAWDVVFEVLESGDNDNGEIDGGMGGIDKVYLVEPLDSIVGHVVGFCIVD